MVHFWFNKIWSIVKLITDMKYTFKHITYTIIKTTFMIHKTLVEPIEGSLYLIFQLKNKIK